MGNTSKINKHLWTNLTRLKLYAKGDKDAKFLLEKNPFDDVEVEKAAVERDEYVITGLVLPEEGIYNETGFEIEMKITSKYPDQPPEVRILTPVYHPNIEADGTFCHQLLSNGSRWKKGTTLVDVVKVVVKYLNKPDPEYSVNFEMCREYMHNKSEFDRKALECVQSYASRRLQ